jgi:hypothetical protein
VIFFSMVLGACPMGVGSKIPVLSSYLLRFVLSGPWRKS